MFFEILKIAIIIRCFLSWIPHSPYNSVIKIIYDVTEPILKPFRMIKIGGPNMMLDLSPIFAFLALTVIQTYLLYPIFNMIARIF